MVKPVVAVPPALTKTCVPVFMTGAASAVLRWTVTP